MAKWRQWVLVDSETHDTLNNIRWKARLHRVDQFQANENTVNILKLNFQMATSSYPVSHVTHGQSRFWRNRSQRPSHRNR